MSVLDTSNDVRVFVADCPCGKRFRAFGDEWELFADACERHADVCDHDEVAGAGDIDCQSVLEDGTRGEIDV